MAETDIKRYPVRGGLYGLMLGISGAYLLYFQFAVFGFDTLGAVIARFVIIILIGVIVGVIWAFVAPPKKPKDPASAVPPSAPAPAPAMEPPNDES